jgi:hypothetical protein
MPMYTKRMLRCMYIFIDIVFPYIDIMYSPPYRCAYIRQVRNNMETLIHKRMDTSDRLKLHMKMKISFLSLQFLALYLSLSISDPKYSFDSGVDKKQTCDFFIHHIWSRLSPLSRRLDPAFTSPMNYFLSFITKNLESGWHFFRTGGETQREQLCDSELLMFMNVKCAEKQPIKF